MGYHRTLTMISDRPGLIAMAAVFSALDITVVVGRFLARHFTRQKLEADDWCSLVSLLLVLNLNGIFIGGVVQGPIGGHSPVVNDWPVTTPLQILSQKYKWAFQSWEKPTFALIKVSILLLWLRFFGGIRRFKISCWVMIGICTAWGIAFTGATVFQCGVHWSWNWADIDWFLTKCSNTLNMLTVFCATDIFTDLIIIALPLPIIWGLNLPLRKRIGIASVFAIGMFTVGAGIARMYIYLVTSYDKENNPDFIGDFTLFILWSDIELNIAMIVSCMPTLGPVLGRIRDQFGTLRRIAFFKSQNNTSPYQKTVSDDGESGIGTRVNSHDMQDDSYIRVSRSYAINASSIPTSDPRFQYGWNREKMSEEQDRAHHSG